MTKKYILSSCVPYLLSCLRVLTDREFGGITSITMLRYIPPFQQNKLAGREFCAAPLVMLPLCSAAVHFGGIQYCFDIEHTSYSKGFQQKKD